MGELFEELPKPIGDFILKQEDIKYICTQNGAYFHYSDVCTLLKRYEVEVNKNETKYG